MQKTVLRLLSCFILFQALVISFQVGAASPEPDDASGCKAQLVTGSSHEIGRALLDILRVRIMPSGNVQASSPDFAPVLLAAPEPLVEGAENGQAQAALTLPGVGEFTLSVHKSAEGRSQLLLCRPQQRENCLHLQELEDGEVAEAFTLIAQDAVNNLVEMRTSRQRYILSLVQVDKR